MIKGVRSVKIDGILDQPDKYNGFFVPKAQGNPGISLGERAMWCAVVYQALSEPERFVKQWIKSSDFIFIIHDILGIDPDKARNAILEQLFGSYDPFLSENITQTGSGYRQTHKAFSAFYRPPQHRATYNPRQG